MKTADLSCKYYKLFTETLRTAAFLVTICASFNPLPAHDLSLNEIIFSDTTIIVQKEAIHKTEPNQSTGIYFVGVPDDLMLNCGESLPEWPLVTATDNTMDYQVTPKERIEFTPCGGRIFTRSWTIINAQGKKISREQKISYSDSEPPILEIGADTLITEDMDMPLPYYEASDQGCSSFTVDITQEEYPLKDGLTAILRKFVATDGCGNSTTKIQHISLKGIEVNSGAKSKSVSALEYH